MLECPEPESNFTHSLGFQGCLGEFLGSSFAAGIVQVVTILRDSNPRYFGFGAGSRRGVHQKRTLMCPILKPLRLPEVRPGHAGRAACVRLEPEQRRYLHGNAAVVWRHDMASGAGKEKAPGGALREVYISRL